jgi:23S rRNA maturation mini-RNase III
MIIVRTTAMQTGIRHQQEFLEALKEKLTEREHEWYERSDAWKATPSGIEFYQDTQKLQDFINLQIRLVMDAEQLFEIA